jgi:hypothetical protein
METKINATEIEINGTKYVPKDSIMTNAKEVDGLKPVLIRSYAAGVHFGLLKEKRETLSGVIVTLVKTRRIWSWYGAASLSQLAVEGIKKPNESKLSMELESNEIVNCVEIIPLTEKAYEQLKNIAVWKV